MHEYARRTHLDCGGLNPEAISDLGKIVGLAFVYFNHRENSAFSSLLSIKACRRFWPSHRNRLAAVLFWDIAYGRASGSGLSSLI